MNELSLFTGAGGGVLGAKLLGHRIIGYVEFNKYCQKVIKQRITDGFLDAAPIFTDIRDFISRGYAGSYTGMVDVLSAGFPCQPFSVAGQQRGADDPRNMWPQTIECIRIIRPRFALLENVPGLLAHRYIQRIFGDLAESGYDARWCVLGADDCGCCHRRKRVWIVAHDAEQLDGKYYAEQMQRQIQQLRVSSCATNVANTPQRKDDRRERGNVDEATEGRQSINAALDACGEDVANTEGITERPGLCQNEPGRIGRGRSGNGSSAELPDTETTGLEGQDTKGNTCADGRTLQFAGRDWWATEPDVGRVAYGVASRVDRLKAIGNGQVSICAAYAFCILAGYTPKTIKEIVR